MGKSRGLEGGRRVIDEKNSKDGSRTLKETKEKIMKGKNRGVGCKGKR